jgi:hypothetical protein
VNNPYTFNIMNERLKDAFHAWILSVSCIVEAQATHEQVQGFMTNAKQLSTR